MGEKTEARDIGCLMEFVFVIRAIRGRLNQPTKARLGLKKK